MIFGNTTIPAGAYALFLLPSEKGTTQLIISKRLGEWGITTTPIKEPSSPILT